jgi:hypothetical protein
LGGERERKNHKQRSRRRKNADLAIYSEEEVFSSLDWESFLA